MTYTSPEYPTNIPSEAELTILFDDIDMYWAKYHNQFNKEIRAIMTELGTLPKGTFATVKARLEALLPLTGSIGSLTTKDHHLLTGLSDDDHSQYYNAARHTHQVHVDLGLLDHGGLTGRGDDDHNQYYNAARHTKTLHNGLAIDHGSLSGKGDDDHTQYYNATRHTKASHDTLGLDHGALSGLGDNDHSQYVLDSAHNKAMHDALNIDADTVDGYDVGNSSGKIPINNGSLCVNLNAEKLNNYRLATIQLDIAHNSTTGWLNSALPQAPFMALIWRKASVDAYWVTVTENYVHYFHNAVTNKYMIQNISGYNMSIKILLFY